MHVDFRNTKARALAGAVIAAALLSAGCSTIVNSGQPTVRRDPNKEQHMNPWVWGNAALAVFPPAAIAGVVVDAYGGHWYEDAGSSGGGNANTNSLVQPDSVTTNRPPVKHHSSSQEVTTNNPSGTPDTQALPVESPSSGDGDALDDLANEVNAN